MTTPKPPPQSPPLFALIFISMFGFTGLALLIFVWSERGDFPPLIFKLVASFIAIAFMAMGFGAPLAALKARASLNRCSPGEARTELPVEGYKCPSCGAGLGQQEVSPSGDVKCTYCQKWWNIHATGR